MTTTNDPQQQPYSVQQQHPPFAGERVDAVAEVARLRACLKHIGERAEAAALGREVVSHWWYGQEVFRALNP